MTQIESRLIIWINNILITQPIPALASLHWKKHCSIKYYIKLSCELIHVPVRNAQPLWPLLNCGISGFYRVIRYSVRNVAGGAQNTQLYRWQLLMYLQCAYTYSVAYPIKYYCVSAPILNNLARHIANKYSALLDESTFECVASRNNLGYCDKSAVCAICMYIYVLKYIYNETYSYPIRFTLFTKIISVSNIRAGSCNRSSNQPHLHANMEWIPWNLRRRHA